MFVEGAVHPEIVDEIVGGFISHLVVIATSFTGQVALTEDYGFYGTIRSRLKHRHQTELFTMWHKLDVVTM